MKNLQSTTPKSEENDNTANTMKMVLGLTLIGELKTRDTWLKLVENDTLDPWTAMIHENVFNIMLRSKTAKVVDALTDTADSCDRVLLSTFRGMLSYKLPPLNLKVTQTEGQKRRGLMLAADIVSNVLIDEGLLVVEEERITKADSTRIQKFVTFTKVNVKDKKKGIESSSHVVTQREVGNRKISKSQKGFIKLLSSQPLVLHSGLSEPVLNHFYTLKDDWNNTHDKNGRKIQWNAAFKRKYYKDMAAEIVEMKDKQYYLPFKFDHRLRVGPEANRMEGIRAHGKTFETLQHCSADSHLLDDECVRVVKQQLYSAREGRAGIDDANSLIKPLHYASVTEDKLLSSDSQKDMGNLMVAKKALESLSRAKAGLPCNNLYGLDLTFSGAIMAGLLFKSPEFLKAGNLYGEDTVTDAHANFGKLFGLSGLERDTAKTMQQPIMHGGHISTLVNLLGDHGIDMGEEEVKTRVKQVYGESVTNINTIADWGVALSCSEYSTMTWTMPDGMIASHKAYQSGVLVDNYAASASHKCGYAHTVQLTNLPYETDKFGKALNAKQSVFRGVTHKVVNHLRGLFADILHSVDSYVLRCIVRDLRALGHTILVKHDNFYTHPRSYSVLIAAAKKVFKEILKSNMLEDILMEIADKSHIKASAPDIIYGDAEDKISESNLFLLP